MVSKCKELTYDEAIADGWEMTGDGFWFKETSEQSGTRSVEYAPDNEYIDNVLIEELILPVETQTDSVQYAWSQDICSNDSDLDTNDYEKLIELVFNEIKKEYKDDETCRLNSLLLGKLLILANQ
ncbi:MAG: hypothetical protein VYE26_03240 [Pseudomonadota bacterium]|nr:hypothetical protein [Pseudomonadota bacterium]